MAAEEIAGEFRKLHDYITLMGKHINQIHSRLDIIEKSIDDIRSTHDNFAAENAKEMATIRESALGKSAFDDFVEKLKTSVPEILPPLPALSKDKPRSEDRSQEATEQ